jgi:hypothetical protein
VLECWTIRAGEYSASQALKALLGFTPQKLDNDA